MPEGEITPTFGTRAQVDRPLAVVNAVNTTPVTWYVHVDHLARPIKMTDAAKASVWDAVWQPWGGQHTITGTAVLDARFPGQWFQLETGLHYNWNRSYDPTIGRYTQPDPLGFVDGPSVYGYARGRPQTAVDPMGLQVPYPPFPDWKPPQPPSVIITPNSCPVPTKLPPLSLKQDPKRICFLIRTEPNHCTYRCRTEEVVLWKRTLEDCKPIIDEDHPDAF